MYNKIILVGRLTRDPELKQTPNGKSVCSFSIAVNRNFGKETDFPNIVAWEKTAEFINKYFLKGSAILVEGELQSRKYTNKQGTEVTVWEVVASNARFVESKSSNKSNDISSNTTSYSTENTIECSDIDDDGDLPF